MNNPTRSHSASFSDLAGLSQDLVGGLLFDEATKDVTLRIQGDCVPAHRAILAARSPVFRAMFFGSMKECALEEVEVHTFAPQTMRLLLRFIYAGNLEDILLEDMVPLMACADHYGVNTLRDTISNHLRDSVTPETACTVLALARTYKQETVTEWYLSFIFLHAQQVARAGGFLQLDAVMLAKVLDADEARIEEIDLFKSLVRWYKQSDRVEEKEAEGLFGRVRYGQMSGQQLVAEVKPLVGEIVPRDLYVWALEQVAAPGCLPLDTCGKQTVRRLPPISTIHTSDPLYLTVNSTEVKKVGPVGWNCTAIIEPSTAKTCFRINYLSEPHNGTGIAVFDPARNTLRSATNSSYPNPNQWGADCLVGIYGTGCFFSLITDHTLRWHSGLTVEVLLEPLHPASSTGGAGAGNSLRVQFSAYGGLNSETVLAETVLAQAPEVLRLALALYSPDDQVTVESAW